MEYILAAGISLRFHASLMQWAGSLASGGLPKAFGPSEVFMSHPSKKVPSGLDSTTRSAVLASAWGGSGMCRSMPRGRARRSRTNAPHVRLLPGGGPRRSGVRR